MKHLDGDETRFKAIKRKHPKSNIAKARHSWLFLPNFGIRFLAAFFRHNNRSPVIAFWPLAASSLFSSVREGDPCAAPTLDHRAVGGRLIIR